MKKLIFLFLCLYNLSFGIVDFADINWGDSKAKLDLVFPKLQEETAIYPGEKIYSFPNPNNGISKYSFHLLEDRLFKVRIVFNKEAVGKSEVKQIYADTVAKMGKNISTTPINEEYGDLKLTGNSMKFIPDIYTFVYLKGVDTIDKDGMMIDSELMLEYVDSAAVLGN